MRSWTVLLPGALESCGECPLFEGNPAPFARMRSRAELEVVDVPVAAVPEAAWVGLDPREVAVAPGPLIVSALGAKPPSRSVHFHLSLLSIEGDHISDLPYGPTQDEIEFILDQAKRLETSKLRIVAGRDNDHGLVWEDGSLELGCSNPEEAVRRGLQASLPEGDGESMLRRFIDDSVNLLDEAEFNAMRREEGLPPINLLWPWGPGMAPELPNLALARGRSAVFESTSPRLAGLCRFVGYRHGDPWGLGSGTNVRFHAFAESARSSEVWVGVLTEPGQSRKLGHHDEAAWLGRELVARLLDPLIALADENRGEIALIATNQEGRGLCLAYGPDRPLAPMEIPFGPAAFEERSIPRTSLHRRLAEVLAA